MPLVFHGVTSGYRDSEIVRRSRFGYEKWYSRMVRWYLRCSNSLTSRSCISLEVSSCISSVRERSAVLRNATPELTYLCGGDSAYETVTSTHHRITDPKSALGKKIGVTRRKVSTRLLDDDNPGAYIPGPAALIPSRHGLALSGQGSR